MNSSPSLKLRRSTSSFYRRNACTSKLRRSEEVEQKQVKIYTTSTCVYCRGAKEYFKEKGIDYEEINLSEHPDRIQEMVQVSGQMGVPVILIDGKMIIGFDRGAIDGALQLN